MAAAYGFVGATASLRLVWPLRAGLLLAAVAGAGVIDLDNRWSWLRRSPATSAGPSSSGSRRLPVRTRGPSRPSRTRKLAPPPVP